MVAYVGMTPKITPKLLISNMIMELMIPYDKVGNGYYDLDIICNLVPRLP